MPYRCEHCQLLSRIDDCPECPQRENCNFNRIAVIHFEHPSGIGKVTGQRSIKTEKDAVHEEVDMRLCCETTTPGAAFTSIYFASTCLDCRDNFEKYTTSTHELPLGE